jgi:integrase
MSRPRHTGSLHRRRNVWWARYYHDGKRIQESTKQTDRAKAEKFLRARLRDADTARFVPPEIRRTTFEDLVSRLRIEHARKGNRSRLSAALTHLSATFHGVPVSRIDADAVDAYVDARLADGGAVATVNRELAALRRAFRLAIAKGGLLSMPKITLRSEHNARQGFLDPADFRLFHAALAAADPVVADAVEFAYLTMLRRGNVLGAAWTWFEFRRDRAGVVSGGTLTVPGLVTKNGDPMPLPLTGNLLALIARRAAARDDLCPYVFARQGRRLDRFDDIWRTAASAIGRPGLLFHDLRRSAARALRRAGVDELTIMARGGWRTRAMFARYAITDERDQVEAQAKLDAALANPGAPTVVPLRGRHKR